MKDRKLKVKVHGECAFLYVEPDNLLEALTAYPVCVFLGN